MACQRMMGHGLSTGLQRSWLAGRCSVALVVYVSSGNQYFLAVTNTNYHRYRRSAPGGARGQCGQCGRALWTLTTGYRLMIDALPRARSPLIDSEEKRAARAATVPHKSKSID